MGLRHLVILRFAPDATEQQIAALAAGLDRLPETIPEIRSYVHGRDLGVSPASWDYAIVAEVASPEDLQAYRDHPEHRAVVRDLLEPIVAERASAQMAM